MKRLAIIRHAKTEQQGYERDFDRRLIERGIEDARNIVVDLKEWNIKPDRIVSSPASRAISTARLFAEGLGFPENAIEEEEGLYFDFTTQDFIDLVRDTASNVETLFIVGHNPFMHYVAQNMCESYDGHMPTCSTVIIDFEVESWKDVEAREGLLFLHLYPKIYK